VTEKVKCPECVRLGTQSKLFMPTGYCCTDMGGSQTFYDEEGHYHHHEVNSATGQGHCTNGHILTVTGSTVCPASDCDYGQPQKITFVPPPPPQPEPEYVTFTNITVRLADPPEPDSGVIIITKHPE
jgi:hypothetical protein